MALVDLKTKQSLVGLTNSISEYGNFAGPDSSTSGYGSTGNAFADFRNAAYGIGPETQLDPDTLADTVSEKLLTQDRSFSGFANPYPTTMFGGAITIPAGLNDLNGNTPTTYQNQTGAPGDGIY
jgi:hypothetical protein|tara:strand:- start:619 stop:990 length:372 start_codon:yes stop_codon:yes gene_type:complete